MSSAPGAPVAAAAPPAVAAPDPALADELADLFASEAAAITARRQQFPGAAAAQHPAALKLPRVGLALSGGGVRSATFALGLMRGLAQTSPQDDAASGKAQPGPGSGGLLGRLDYLSTVSGGGYIGAMYGRLVATYGLREALALMASSRSPVLGWLRRNGRYLTPAGSRDTGIAVVTYLRSWLAIHTEFMFACILLALLVVAPHLWQHTFQTLDTQGWERWRTPWWAAAVALWTATAPGLVAGYWTARDGPDPGAMDVPLRRRDAIFILLVAFSALLLLRALLSNGGLDPVRHSLNWPGAGVLALVSVVAGQFGVMVWVARRHEPHALKVARLRNWLTRALRWALLASLALAGLGALDRLSWWVLEEFQTGNRWLWGGVGLGGLVVLVLRALMQPLQKIAAESGTRALDWWPRLLNAASLVGLLALVSAWLVLMQWFIFAPQTFDAIQGAPAWMRAAVLGLLWLGWILLTAGNAQMANTSSLHSFYRARLTRAYLAVGNRARELADAHGERADVTRVVEGDDTSLRHYRPEQQGGPIHLVNTCLNQTRDDRSGLYNADRKGTGLTATWRGLEIGQREFVAHRPEHDTGTLGRWVSVSGAAASPGAGAYTSRGLALLVYFLGVRLGHWMRAPRERVRLRWLSDLAWRALPKPMMLASEASATFFGVERPWWYLSDGGHFENTGVYPLLKRELDFILLSDASCDANYEFGDIENLVRKARIDFGAEIDFYSREEAATLFTLGSPNLTILSPEDMADNHSCRGVLLARIRYRERPGPAAADGTPGRPLRPEGTLLLVKPNLHDALDVDLLAYAEKHPAFPHESTGDQSFDEAQWESYHRLGEDFGRAVHESWLAQLPGWRAPARHGIRVAARLGAPRDAASAAAREPLWRRNARAAAIGTTLGVGASGTLLLSMWQVQDQLQRNRSDERAEARQLFTDVSRGLQDFKGSCPRIPEHVVTQALQMLELRGSPTLRPLEQAGIERLAGRISDECKLQVDASTDCLAASKRIQNDLCAPVLKLPSANTALSYWHPDASPQDQARESRRALVAFAVRFPVLGSLLPDNATRVAASDVEATAADGAAPTAAASGIVGSPPAAAPPAVPAPVTAVRPPAPIPAGPGAGPAGAIQFPSLQACQFEGGRTTVYIQIFDEESRGPASDLRQALLADTTTPVMVAPIENVIRSADLRQQRRPVPWPRPTLILHDPGHRECARTIARYIGAPWVVPGDTERVRLRDLPRSLQAQPGVIELWLPPPDSAPAPTAAK